MGEDQEKFGCLTAGIWGRKQKGIEMAEKYDKVYIVHTGLVTRNEGDMSNWSSHKVVTKDAESAIKKAKPKFKKGEYAESVELVTILD